MFLKPCNKVLLDKLCDDYCMLRDSDSNLILKQFIDKYKKEEIAHCSADEIINVAWKLK